MTIIKKILLEKQADRATLWVRRPPKFWHKFAPL